MTQENLHYQQLIEPGEVDQSEQILIDEFLYKCCQKDKESPLEKAGIFSRLFFTWMNPILSVRFKTNQNS